MAAKTLRARFGSPQKRLALPRIHCRFRRKGFFWRVHELRFPRRKVRIMTQLISARMAHLLAAMLACLALIAAPVSAQDMETVDPNLVIDGDLDSGESVTTPSYATPAPATSDPGFSGAMRETPSDRYQSVDTGAPRYESDAAASEANPQAAQAQNSSTYASDDLIGAAEGVFGRGAEGLARLIEDILAEQGQPNGYIVGREGGGAFILGVRYGSGTLHHKIEGNIPVYWTGPSVGLDAGANAANTFVLVYNLNDTEELFSRFPAGEGQAYLVGGFNVSYLRKGNKVLIPIRVGAGLRLGVNAGYMRFSRKQRWLPF